MWSRSSGNFRRIKILNVISTGIPDSRSAQGDLKEEDTMSRIFIQFFPANELKQYKINSYCDKIKSDLWQGLVLSC